MTNRIAINLKSTLAICGSVLLMTAAACSPQSNKEEGAPKTEQSSAAQASSSSEDQKDIRIYTLDCGSVDFSDLGLFSSGEYAGRAQKMAVPCFLIRHPDGDMVWDAGIPDTISQMPNGLPILEGLAVASVPVTMKSQFEKLGLSTKDVEYLALSHAHFDHVGNVGQFTDSTLLIHKTEHDFMFGAGVDAGVVDAALVEPLRTVDTVFFEAEHDVFGDGKVIIIPMPGHSPGHSVLLVKLKNKGTVMFSGDLFHLAESRERKIVPVINPDREQTLKSMDSFNARVIKENAEVIIQHDLREFNALPKIPEYLD